METAIRWSPSSTTLNQRFLIADVNGRAFKHCNVEKFDGKSLQYETISTHRMVPAFRAFDWSPHDEAIVAVGQWSGEATVLRIDDQSQSLSLPIKHQRLCNAVAFSRTGLLATGLERVRNDFCLNVWDINQRPLTKSSTPSSGRLSMDPVRKLASSEAITSIKFFPSQPDVLVCGIKGASVRIYDTRDHTGNSLFQSQTTCVHNIAIDPLDENYFASAGSLKDTTIHIFDRRSGSSSTAANLGAGSPQLSQQGPMLEFKRAFEAVGPSLQANIWSLRYCKGQSGCLAALASTGDYKIFETKKDYRPTRGMQLEGQGQMAKDDIVASAQRIYTRRIQHIEHAFDNPTHSRSEKQRIVSFDFTNLAGCRGRPCAITLRGDQTVEINELRGPSSVLSVSPMGNLAISRASAVLKGEPALMGHIPLPTIVRIISPSEDTSIAESMSNARAHLTTNQISKSSRLSKRANGHSSRRDTSFLDNRHLSSREAHEKLHKMQPGDGELKIELALSFFTTCRRRAAEGYSADCKRNIEILSDDPWLQDFWAWVYRAKSNAVNDKMVPAGVDLSYLGVYAIWNNYLGHQSHLRQVNQVETQIDLSRSVDLLCEKLELPDSSSRETAHPKRRQLCLHTCGLGLPYEILEEKVKDLVRKGHNTRASALAIIHDQPKLAFLALRNGAASSAHRELSLALAGFVKGNTDDTWNETVQEIAKELDDPYARAVLALVSQGDWHDVLAETSLPLRDRVGIALMYLDDEELTDYIGSTTAECIEQGDIEGVVLTGLTEQSLPLFQTYIRKFGDLQTTILALSHTSPRYFSSPLVDHWRESYRSFLNTCRLFLQRVQFDIQSTKLSTPPNRKPLLPPAPRQISLRCNNCDQALDRNPENIPFPPAPSPSSTTAFGTTHQGSIFGDSRAGTICPKCGRHMPRCVICMLRLGMPDPSSKGALEAGRKKKGVLAGAGVGVGAGVGAGAGVGVSGGAGIGIGTTGPAINATGEKSAPGGGGSSSSSGSALDDFITVCRSCWHMSHGSHAEEWFAEHEVCPVPECECRCGEMDGAGP